MGMSNAFLRGETSTSEHIDEGCPHLFHFQFLTYNDHDSWIG
jgi:hypothetical protein